MYIPEDKPAEIARTALRQRTVIGYRYVQRGETPEPVATTMTAMFVSGPWPDDNYECGPVKLSSNRLEFTPFTAGRPIRGFQTWSRFGFTAPSPSDDKANSS